MPIELRLGAAFAGAAMFVCALGSAAGQGLSESDKVVWTARLMAPLVNSWQQPQLPPRGQVDGIIALGGGAARTVEAVRLAQLYPNAKLVVTGASTEDYALARAQGRPDGRLVLEFAAQSTYQNALFTSRLVHPGQTEHWLLVTSATHMPRAAGAFQAAGFNVLPWPIRDINPANPFAWRIVLHEWLGLVAYYASGRTPRLIPSARQ